MDSSSLKLLGFSKPAPKLSAETDPAQKGSSDQESKPRSEAEGEESVLYALLDYYPSADVSYFFTFVISGMERDKISMDHHQPMHLDTQSPGCTVLLRDDALCMTGTVDGSLVLWDVTTQKMKSSFYDREMVKAIAKGQLQCANASGKPAHSGAVTCMALSADGTMLATGGADGCVKLWDPAGRRLLASLAAHKTMVSRDTAY